MTYILLYLIKQKMTQTIVTIDGVMLETANSGRTQVFLNLIEFTL